MKQTDIKVGNSYLFKDTTIEHRKDLVGTVVIITGKKKRGKGKLYAHACGLPCITGGYVVYKIENGRTVNASELQEISSQTNTNKDIQYGKYRKANRQEVNYQGEAGNICAPDDTEYNRTMGK